MPASTAFNPTTAYREDWRYIDGVEDGVLVVRRSNAEQDAAYPVKLLRADTTRPDFQRMGIAANFSPHETVWYLWLIYPAATPEPPAPRGADGGAGDAFEIQGSGDQPDYWMIQSVHESRIGSLYVLGCVKGRVNAD